jgi:hypothetical protein
MGKRLQPADPDAQLLSRNRRPSFWASIGTRSTRWSRKVTWSMFRCERAGRNDCTAYRASGSRTGFRNARRRADDGCEKILHGPRFCSHWSDALFMVWRVALRSPLPGKVLEKGRETRKKNGRRLDIAVKASCRGSGLGERLDSFFEAPLPLVKHRYSVVCRFVRKAWRPAAERR